MSMTMGREFAFFDIIYDVKTALKEIITAKIDKTLLISYINLRCK